MPLSDLYLVFGLVRQLRSCNYGAVKIALVGVIPTLSSEGAKYDIRVNCLAHTSAMQMTEGRQPESVLNSSASHQR